MATQGHFTDLDSFKKLNSIPIRTTIETAFYGNNVIQVKDLKEAYALAKDSPGTVELDGMPIHRPTELGLPTINNTWVRKCRPTHTNHRINIASIE